MSNKTLINIWYCILKCIPVFFFNKYVCLKKKTHQILLQDLVYTTSYITRAMPRVNFFCIKNTQKKLRSKSVRFFYKAISRNLGFGCNAWPKSNIYNINNNIKLAWPSRSSCNTWPNSLGCGSNCKVVS